MPPSFAKRVVSLVAVFVISFACRPPSATAHSDKATSKIDSVLASRLKPLLAQHKGEVAVAIEHLITGARFEHRADAVMPTASLIKLSVLMETYRQVQSEKRDLNQMLTLRQRDKVPGSGVLTPHFSAGARIPLRDAVQLMIVYSDNTATNLVLDQIGLERVNKTMLQWGLPNTRIHAKVFRRKTSIAPARSKKFGLGSTTAAETLRIYKSLHHGKLLDRKRCKVVLGHLKQCADRNKLARLLPPGTEIAHKGGSVSASRCDAGIIYGPSGPFVVAVFTTANQDRSWTDNRAEKLCGRIARTAYDHFNRGQAPNIRDDLRSGSSGLIVEELQRTLNARLKPSPELSIDGDFGPNTAAAVRRFQGANKLAVTGVVDAAFWKKLGPIVAPRPVPAPKVINAEKLPKSPPDALQGRPFVSCKAWIIGDKSGKRLWGTNDDVRLDIASTTKIMTAYVILSRAEKKPSILNEIVTFSRRADQTPGSTAGIRWGERIEVGELLYGLLLPSGNDASVALAEHFGQRWSEPELTPDKAFENFVAQMNREAKDLGMTRTHFDNPHGLTSADHQSTAADLLKLAAAAMKIPRFRQYVATRQHGTTVAGRPGYTRNVVWKNTNRLLASEGYGGLKTGTTSAAGACLVSSAKRDGRELILVVLGASGSKARYADSRNLYRWAWQQPARD